MRLLEILRKIIVRGALAPMIAADMAGLWITKKVIEIANDWLSVPQRAFERALICVWVFADCVHNLRSGLGRFGLGLCTLSLMCGAVLWLQTNTSNRTRALLFFSPLGIVLRWGVISLTWVPSVIAYHQVWLSNRELIYVLFWFAVSWPSGSGRPGRKRKDLLDKLRLGVPMPAAEGV